MRTDSTATAAMNLERALNRLSTLVTENGGVARSPTLQRQGISRHVLDTALGRGLLVRVRRGWVAQPGADAFLVSAARAGVVLTCITQAKRLGLWVLDSSQSHVAAPPHAGRVAATGPVVHWAQPVVPRHPDALVDPIENVLAAVAACQPYENALAIWESAFNKRLVKKEKMSRLALPAAARRVCAAATPFSDSGLETFVLVRLRWLPVPVVVQVWVEGHRIDFLIGKRLALQVDGGHHVGAQRDADIAHDAQLMLLGFHVIRVSYKQVVDNWPEVQQLILQAIAQGLHLPD